MVEISAIYALCRTYGPLLSFPPGSGIDGAHYMAAEAWLESTCGKNITPRYEKSYDIGGENYRNEQIPLIAYYAGKTIFDADRKPYPLDHNPAAYSWGIFQMMPCNAKGFSIQELAVNPESDVQAFLGFFNRYIMGVRHAMTLEEMFQCYNSGHYCADPEPGVYQYVVDGLKYYQAIDLSNAAEININGPQSLASHAALPHDATD